MHTTVMDGRHYLNNRNRSLVRSRTGSRSGRAPGQLSFVPTAGSFGVAGQRSYAAGSAGGTPGHMTCVATATDWPRPAFVTVCGRAA